MKKILAALSLCSASIFGAAYESETLKIVPFSIEAPRFYDKADSVLARSEPIKLSADIKAGKTVSLEAAAQAFRELRSMRKIRDTLGAKNPNAKLLDRRGGGFFGVFASPDYSEKELDDIQTDLAKAGKIANAETDPLENARTKIIEKNSMLSDESNQNLTQFIFLEKLAQDLEKNSRSIVKLAQEIGIGEEMSSRVPITASDYPWVLLPDVTRNSPQEFLTRLKSANNPELLKKAFSIIAGFREFAQERNLFLEKDAFPDFTDIDQEIKNVAKNFFLNKFLPEARELLRIDVIFRSLLVKLTANPPLDKETFKKVFKSLSSEFLSALPNNLSKSSTSQTSFERILFKNLFAQALKEKDPASYTNELIERLEASGISEDSLLIRRIQNGSDFIALIENRDTLSADTIKKIIAAAHQYDSSKSAEQQSSDIKELANNLNIQKLLPKTVSVEPEKKDVQEPEKILPIFSASTKDFYTALLGKIPTLFYGQLKKSTLSPQEASNLFKKIRASKQIRSALNIAEESFEGTIKAILSELKKIAGDIPDTLAPLRAGIVEKIKSDTAKLNQLVELETLWGTDEENQKNKEKILALAQEIGIAEDIKQHIPEPLAAEETTPEEKEPVVVPVPEKVEEPFIEEPIVDLTKPADQPEIPAEKIKPQEPVVVPEETPAEPMKEPTATPQYRPKQPGKRPPSRKESEIPVRFKTVEKSVKASIKDAADALMLKNIDGLWEDTDPNNQKIVIQAAKELGIWETIKEIPNGPKEQALAQEQHKEKNPPTKKALAASLAQAAQIAKKVMTGKAPQPTPVVNIASSLEKLSTTLQKLTTAIAPTK